MARHGLRALMGCAGLLLVGWTGSLAAQADVGELVSRASWGADGITVRFPAEYAPHLVSLDTIAPDHFSGLEWRIVLEGGQTVFFSAFVIPPDPETRQLVRYDTIEDALNAGGAHVRRCEKDILTFRCARPASALVRPSARGELEVAITDFRWLALAAQSEHPVLHLAVRRLGAEVWSGEFALVLADH
jgi:hypothetical protein